ncbi:leucine--tRNA ligase [bacterium]|nr:leucine--tRNA ligase [bacterium]
MYKPEEIEKKWQKIWEEKGVFKTKEESKKKSKKIYILVEFPYPSGEGLHTGHCRSYTAFDVIARKKRMEGYNVLFPMGWDAFGLPTENFAIKTKTHPKIVTEKNIKNFKRQEKSLGLSFNWDREINTSDPDYYKWTQWIFIQLYKKGLAYKAKIPINWCPSCKIGLANEEVVNGCCERCGTKVIKKEKEQWMLKITKYADRLIKDLDLVDYPERVKILEKDWIGRSKGLEVTFQVSGLKENYIKVFTTRVDTIFGCTYLAIAPEHKFIEEAKEKIKNFDEVKKYVRVAKNKSDRERISQEKIKSGVKIKGIAAINPATNKEIPIFVADYVMPSYATGAVMGVPAHDQRDFDFAKKYGIPIIEVIKSDKDNGNTPLCRAYEGEGVLVNSGEFSSLKSEKARIEIAKFLKNIGLAKDKIYYKLKDWVFSRQRYWGEPIPMIKCPKCGWVPVPEKDLPVRLPNIDNYQPTETGQSPLAKIDFWVNVKCPVCGANAKRETDVMPNWAGSNWYYLRYCDPKNNNELAAPEKLEYWMPVDWYNGGMEHTTLHLLYSRFVYKFLWDIGAVPKPIGPEPYKKRTSHGMILAKGGVKMSKSKGNIVNPDEIINEYGADAMRMYEMFMGPFEQAIVWDTKGLKGVRKFLDKVWNSSQKLIDFYKVNKAVNLQSEKNLEKLANKTIKQVSEDIENLKFNTAVSWLMKFYNNWQKNETGLSKEDFEKFLKIFSVFAPHMAEELWQKLGHKSLISAEKWPKYDPGIIKEDKFILIIQVNGKLRAKIMVESGISKKEAEQAALALDKVKKWTKGKKIKKVIFVSGRLINFVL